jgi:hypothetical protein
MQCQIRDWFAKHDGEDGDFFISSRGHPFSVVPPRDTTETVVYCTKQHCILTLFHDLCDEPSFAAILRSGLPSEAEADWLGAIVGSRRFLFLGDADPADLLIFAYLRERVAIKYLGLTDELFFQCGVPLGDNLTIAMSESELAASSLMSECFVDLQTELGKWCSGLLRSGHKVELEALFSFATCSPSQMAAAFVAKPDRPL